MGATVVGATVVGATVVGGAVVGGAVVGGAVVGPVLGVADRLVRLLIALLALLMALPQPAVRTATATMAARRERFLTGFRMLILPRSSLTCAPWS